MTAWRTFAVGLAVLAYALFSHWVITFDPSRPWLIAAPVLPILGVTLLLALARRQWRLAALSAATLGLFAGLARWGSAGHVGQLYLLQHGGAHLGLAWMFGITLRPGSVPLITRLAQVVHREVTPDMTRYTRGLTAFWVGYFLAMVAGSLLLYAFAPWSWWSLFVNVLTPVGLGLVFVVEHVVRYRLHPEFERVTMARAVDAFRRATAGKAG